MRGASAQSDSEPGRPDGSKSGFQFELKNLQGRSARLDIYAVDEHGKQYDVEVQRSDDGAAPRRARYNSSLLDANLLNPGDKFDELPESYIFSLPSMTCLKAESRFTRSTARFPSLTTQYSRTVRT